MIIGLVVCFGCIVVLSLMGYFAFVAGPKELIKAEKINKLKTMDNSFKFLNFNNVLCLSPHPDDVEYSMAGVVLKYKETHFDILCMTHGGDFDPTTDKKRLMEVEDSWRSSGSSNYTLHFTSNKFLRELKEDAWVNYIETKFLDEKKYDCIITPSELDSHFEHKFVSVLGWPLTRIRPISVIEYASPSTLNSWVPNLYVDISDFYNTKVKMLTSFESQKNRPYFSIDTLDGFHTNFQCSKKGVSKVEKFNIKQLFSL